MTEDNTTEINDPEGDPTPSDDSSVIKQLRQQLKDAQKELKAVPSRSDVESEVRAAVAREVAIERQLVALKQPEGLRPLIEEKLGDAEVDAEGVTEALKAIGFEITDSPEGGDEEASENLSDVANLSNQVANAANQGDTDDFSERLAQTETPEDVAALMAELDL